MDKEKLNRIKSEVLREEITPKLFSNDYAGVYLHSNSPFKLEDHQASIHAFRAYSQYTYPLYLFISQDAITEDVKKLIELYSPITVVRITRLNNIYEFNNFCINNLLYLVDPKHENLLITQYDGFAIKSGWEEACEGYSWLGAAWKDEIQVIENQFNCPPVRIGNGGANFRRRSKCLRVNDLVNKHGGQEKIVSGLKIGGERKTYGPFLAEDAYFAYFGFGLGIFEPVTLNYANSFSLEPITWEQYNQSIKPSYLFHRIDE